MARIVISTITMVICLMGVTAKMSLQVVVINLTSKVFFLLSVRKLLFFERERELEIKLEFARNSKFY